MGDEGQMQLACMLVLFMSAISRPKMDCQHTHHLTASRESELVSPSMSLQEPAELPLIAHCKGSQRITCRPATI